MSGRASLSNGAKTGVPTLAKLAGSLAQTVHHMEVRLVSVLAWRTKGTLSYFLRQFFFFRMGRGPKIHAQDLMLTFGRNYFSNLGVVSTVGIVPISLPCTSCLYFMCQRTLCANDGVSISCFPVVRKTRISDMGVVSYFSRTCGPSIIGMGQF